MWPDRPKDDRCNTCKYKFSDRDCTASCNYGYYLDKVVKDNKDKTNADIIRELSDRDLSYFLDDIIDRCINQDCDRCPIPHKDGTCDTFEYLTQTLHRDINNPYLECDRNE